MGNSDSIIHLKDVRKEFKLLNRHEGLKGSFQDLFSRDYKVLTAVNDVILCRVKLSVT